MKKIFVITICLCCFVLIGCNNIGHKLVYNYNIHSIEKTPKGYYNIEYKIDDTTIGTHKNFGKYNNEKIVFTTNDNGYCIEEIHNYGSIKHIYYLYLKETQ